MKVPARLTQYPQLGVCICAGRPIPVRSESCLVRPCMHQRNPSSSHLRSCLSPAVRHAYSRQIQPTDTAAAVALSPQWRRRPPPQLSRHLRLTLVLCDRPTQLVAATPLQPVEAWWRGMRWSVHGSAGVLLNEQLTPPTLKDGKRKLPFRWRLVSWTPPKLHPYSLDGLPSPDY